MYYMYFSSDIIYTAVEPHAVGASQTCVEGQSSLVSPPAASLSGCLPDGRQSAGPLDCWSAGQCSEGGWEGGIHVCMT